MHEENVAQRGHIVRACGGLFLCHSIQTRGNQHDHGLLWIADALIIDIDNDQLIENFIDQHITTNIKLLPDELKLAQTHHHTKTCKKEKYTLSIWLP